LGAADFVRDAVILIIGAFIVWQIILVLSQSYPDFRQYGWTLMAAYITGAVLYLKYGPKRDC